MIGLCHYVINYVGIKYIHIITRSGAGQDDNFSALL